jgi:hypothetical protein
MSTIRLLFLLVLFLTYTQSLTAQIYIGKKSQHRFAQSYLGINMQVVPTSGNFIWDESHYAFPFLASPRISLGGLHFWGKLDFTMNFPLYRIAQDEFKSGSFVRLYTGGDLGARFYPWRVEFGKIRPFIGFSANEMTLMLSDQDRGSRDELFVTSSILGGFSYAFNGWQVHAEWMWMPDHTRTFYSDRVNEHTVQLPASYFSFGLIKYFEGTIREESDKESGRAQEYERALRQAGQLNNFSISFAPSGAYFLLAPPLDDAFRVSLPRHKASMVWEYGAGYLFHDAGIHLGISYRDYQSSVESYQLEHVIRRRSVALEARKFLWNYQGFVPFIGPSLSIEQWATGEFEQNIQLGNTTRTRFLSPGIVFGWDILASPLETWVLRTNLRYYPFQRIEIQQGKRARVDQFEFNFIQLVIYPNRLKNIPSMKKRMS